MSALYELHKKMMGCVACPLSQGRTQVVPGEGDEKAQIMFIGEGPGFHEDNQGRPFVGPAGKFLEELLASIGLRREQVFITNVIKCRPPNNRDPLPAEIATCKPWLDQQVELIKPKVIVTLGRYSMARYFPGESISKIHGKPRRSEDGTILFPMYHPAAALHQQSLRAALEEDIRKIPQLLEEAKGVEEEIEKAQEEPRQLSFF